MLIWAIPSLSPPSDLPDRFLDNNPAPLFKIPFPAGIVHHHHQIFKILTVSSWYFGSWESLYFDIISQKKSEPQRYKINIKPDLSDASLHVIKMYNPFSDDSTAPLLVGLRDCDGYRICDGALVYFGNNDDYYLNFLDSCAGLTRTSAPSSKFFFTDMINCWNHKAYSDIFSIKSICPASGRFVHYRTYVSSRGNYDKIIIVDLF